MSTLAVEFTDARGLLAKATAFLAAEPVLNTVLTTTAHRLADEGPKPWPQWFAIVRDGSEVVGVAMRTAPFEPYPLYVLPMSDAAANAIVRALAERGEDAPGANGFLPAAHVIMTGVAGGREVISSERMRLYELGTRMEPRPARGHLRRATRDDLDLALRWFNEFHPAADEQSGRVYVPQEKATRERVQARIESGDVFFWLDGGPVHMTAAFPPSFGVARIGPVYTPIEHRGHGYASATVFAVSRDLQRAGVRVCLFADEENATSNKIYEALGFRHVSDTANHTLRSA